MMATGGVRSCYSLDPPATVWNAFGIGVSGLRLRRSFTYESPASRRTWQTGRLRSPKGIVWQRCRARVRQ